MKLKEELMQCFEHCSLVTLQDPQALAEEAEFIAKRYAEKVIRALVDIKSSSVYMDGSHSIEPDMQPARNLVYKAFPDRRGRGDSMEHLIKMILEDIDNK